MEDKDSKDKELIKKMAAKMEEAKTQQPAKDLRETIASLKGTVDMLLGVLLKTPEFADLKYNEKELLLIEEKVNEMFPEGHKPLPTTLIPFGFYLGEFFIKKFRNAKWNISDKMNEEGDIFSARIEFTGANGNTMQVYPFLRAKKFWLNREDKMSSLYRIVNFTTEISMDKEYWSKRAFKDGWIQLAMGDCLRLYQGEKGNTDPDADFSDSAKGMFHNGTLGSDKR